MQAVTTDVFGVSFDVVVLLRQIDQDDVMLLHNAGNSCIVCLNAALQYQGVIRFEIRQECKIRHICDKIGTCGSLACRRLSIKSRS